MKKIIFFLALFGAISAQAQSLDKNFSRVLEPKVPMHTNVVELLLLLGNTDDFIDNINYHDGLGRRLQTVAKKQTPLGKDIIRHYEYDQFGRMEKEYLPFASTQNTGNLIDDPIPLINSFYSARYGDSRPYAQTRFDSSPLNRVLESSGPGDDWAINSTSDDDHTMKLEYGTNGRNQIRRFDFAASGNLIASYYNNNELIKTVSKDENWEPSDGKINTTEVYTDKNGRKIAEIVFEHNSSEEVEERLTQYVYDDLGRLRYLLPPKFFTASGTANYSDYSINWPLNDFLEVGTYMGNLIFNINSNVVDMYAFQGVGQHNLLQLKPSTTKVLSTTPTLPNMYLGKIMGQSSLIGGPLIHVGDANIVGGNLVITRVSTDYFISFSMDISQDLNNNLDYSLLDDLAYQYEYDEYNRRVAQKVPGKGWEYLIYDQLDRAILTQDAELKSQDQWIFTKFDAFNRVAYGGKYYSNKTREELQTEVDNAIIASGNLSNIEKRSHAMLYLGGVTMNYTNTAFPTSGITEILMVTYYDDYSFSDTDIPSTPTSVQGQDITTKLKGLQTAKWMKTVGENKWTKIYTYYDRWGRPVRIFNRNHLGGYTQNDNVLDFRGKITSTVTEHRRLATDDNLVIKDDFEYDNSERPTLHYQKINSQNTEMISNLVYDELGMIASKKVGGEYSSTSSTSPLQSIEYKYNIRGWLTNINDVSSLDDDLFAYQLSYNSGAQGTASVDKRYNGQITQAVWNSARDNVKKAYAYEYDDLSRIQRTHYRQGNLLSLGAERFDTYGITYDANSNIKGLRRTNQEGQVSDDLNYGYDVGNKLLSVRDNSTLPTEGFLDGNPGGTDYDYDDNGNLILDNNRKIERIYYNHLNLVTQVSFLSGNNIYFTYNIAGEKLQKRFVSSSGGTTTTDYLGGFQYRNTQLEFFPTPEGYVSKEGSNFRYSYIYSDHLGSTRVSFSDLDKNGSVNSLEIVSNTDYYAMGMRHAEEYVSSFASGFDYRFQGKELQREANLLQYDFGSRMYDPSLGRWFNTDPRHQFTSPFVAMGNDHVNQIDPNGEEALTLLTAIVVASTVIGGATAAIVTLSNGGNGLDALGAFIRGATMAGFMSAASNAPAVFAGKVLGSASAAKIIAKPATWKAVAGKFAASYSKLDLPITDNFSITLSPALASGTNQSGYGFNVAFNGKVGNITFGIGIGSTKFTSNELLKGQGPGDEFRFSKSFGFDDGKTVASISSTIFSDSNSDFNQKVGGLTLGLGDFSFTYENDWMFGLPIADGGDRYRTAAAKITIGDFSAGLNIFTGDPRLDDANEVPGYSGASVGGKYNNKTGQQNGIYKGINAGKYRLGVLYLGYKNYRVGYNSEVIRAFFQNKVVHDTFGVPRFEKLDIKGSFYYQYQYNTPFTTW